MKLHYFEWLPKDVNGTALPNSNLPVIFLHGMGGTGAIWRPITAQLENDFRCIALDQRGHGGSRPVPEEVPKYGALDYAQDVVETLNSIGIDHFLLIGHSMGVRTGLGVLHLIPERVAGFIAVDIGIASEFGGGIGLPLANFMQTLPASFPSRVELKEYLFRECPDPSIAMYLHAVSKKVSDTPEAWSFPFDNFAIVKTVHSAHGTPIEEWVVEGLDRGIPMAFLRGMNSKVWLKNDYEAQKARIVHPLLEFEEWENAGHGLPFEQRAKFVSFVQNFIKKIKR